MYLVSIELFLQNNYIYVMPDGTKKEFDEPQENLKVHQVPSPPTTIVTTSTDTVVPPAISESGGDDWEWEEGFQEDPKPTPP